MVPPLVQAFKPDVLVTQLGIDTHVLDPITHLRLTVQGYTQAVRELAALSPGRWLALGGGGYDIGAVMRAWTRAYGVMLGHEWPDSAPPAFAASHGVDRFDDPPQAPLPPEGGRPCPQLRPGKRRRDPPRGVPAARAVAVGVRLERSDKRRGAANLAAPLCYASILAPVPLSEEALDLSELTLHRVVGIGVRRVRAGAAFGGAARLLVHR